MYYTQEQINRANQADLVSFLQSQGEQLTRAGNEYRWKRHDSLTVRGNKWYRHSQSKGGGPVDFVIEFFGKSFTEAVELLTGEKGAAPSPDRPCPASLSDFRLPPPNSDNMNNETSKTSTPAAASPLTAKPDLVKNIGGTTFDIHIHFSETSRETFTDKVVRLIQNDSGDETA